MIEATLRKPEELAAAGLIERGDVAGLKQVATRYAVALTPYIASLVDPNDPNDPIARQFIPSRAELLTTPEERADPIGDQRHSPVSGIVHRHEDRVLFMPVKACPVYCRFCFRRESVGPQGESALSPEALDRAFGYIAAHPEIREVILTGGDPFILSPRRAAGITARLSEIPHVKVLRWHTRVPAVDPARVSDELVAAIKLKGRATFVALHANHPRELGDAARTACAKLIDAGIPMLSQTVLLRGVNDDISTLEALMRTFVEMRIKPYYLHHADLAPGTSHFRVTVEEGRRLMRELTARVSGLCVPQYVLDIPGGYSKARISQSDLRENTDGVHVRDGAGNWHAYPPPEAD